MEVSCLMYKKLFYSLFLLANLAVNSLDASASESRKRSREEPESTVAAAAADGTAECAAKREREACPICIEGLDVRPDLCIYPGVYQYESIPPVTFCKDCGNKFHTTCVNMGCITRFGQEKSFSCPMCRGEGTFLSSVVGVESIVSCYDELRRLAAAGKKGKLIRLFEREKIDLNAVDESGLPLLHLIFNGRDLNLFTFILGLNTGDYGYSGEPVNINAKDGRGNAIVHKIAEEAKPGDENFLLALASAPRFSGRELDLSSRNPYGQTALHIATIRRNFKIFECLLLSYANPNTLDRAQKSPLYEAVIRRNKEFARYLMRCGASPVLGKNCLEAPAIRGDADFEVILSPPASPVSAASE